MKTLKSAQEIWNLGIPLREAWFHCTTKRNQEIFRSKINRVDSDAFQFSLCKDLEMAIRADEFQAVGIKVEPSCGAPFEVIPMHLFNDTAKINWNEETLFSAGLKFTNLKIGKLRKGLQITRKSNPKPIPDIPSIAVSAPADIQSARKKSGPKPGFEMVKAAYLKLKASAEFNTCKKTADEVRKLKKILKNEVQQFPGARGLADKTLYGHIRKIKNNTYQ